MSRILICLMTLMQLQVTARPAVDIEGCFAFNSISNNLRILLIEKFGLVFENGAAVNVFGEQLFRNSSFANSLFAGAEYRFKVKKFGIPVGAFGGVNDIHIGRYSAVIPVAGVNTGCFFKLGDAVSLRVNYFGKLYFDRATVWGNDIVAGVGLTIPGGR